MTMKLKQAASNSWGNDKGKGFILYGNRPDTGKWLERWYPTREKARAFCTKRGWEIEES